MNSERHPGDFVPPPPDSAVSAEALAREPGEYEWEKVSRRIGALFWAYSLTLVALGVAIGFGGPVGTAIGVVAAAVLLGLGYLSRAGGQLDAFGWLKGLRGEQIVAGLLGTLEQDGFVLVHGIDTGRGNVDHAVVGPSGVFAIETKNWNGSFYPAKGDRLMHGGKDRSDLVRQAHAEAMALRDRLQERGLDMWVTAILVSTRSKVLGTKIDFKFVTVIGAGDLVPFIRGGRQKLSPDQIKRAVAALAR